MWSTFKVSVSNKLRKRLSIDIPTVPEALERITRHGFSPKTVFDVGAYVGEFAELSRTLWPQCSVACFEGQPHGLKKIQELSQRDAKVKLFPTLLGSSTSGSVELHTAETASSVLKEHVKNHPSITVPMTTIDAVVDEHYGGHGPDFLKIDTQGYELEILKGGERSLGRCKAILAEVNLIDIHIGVGLLADIVAWLRQRGFLAFDICSLMRRPLDMALWQADMIFVPEDSPLRADKRWDHVY